MVPPRRNSVAHGWPVAGGEAHVNHLCSIIEQSSSPGQAVQGKRAVARALELALAGHPADGAAGAHAGAHHLCEGALQSQLR